MHRLLTLLCVCFCLTAHAQFTLTGRVKDAQTRQAIAGASVFIANSQSGTTTQADGAFSLYIPQGKYDVVISNVGYETQVLTADNNMAREQTIALVRKAKELDEVVVTSYEKDGWNKWGTFFLEQFIGTVPNAEKCTLKNKEKVRFKRNLHENTLTAVASEPLVVENKALGYVLTYQLEDFTYNFKTRIFYYEGYPLFTEMKGSERQQRKWQENRARAYYGSVQHFMRSLYRNRVKEEGFEMRKLVRKENTEKQRIKALYAQRARSGRLSFGDGSDSSRYYENILSQPDYVNMLYKPLLTGDSVAYAIDSTTAGLYFTDYLDVMYTKAKAPAPYGPPGKQTTDEVSQMSMLKNSEIAIWQNGSHYPTRSILTEGYWAWSEKAGNMLPLGYKPPPESSPR
jgi:hypothetical protein